ncbi:hypothetical protein [Campylobacter mucosalis]|uniref:Uncharacterized protein n=1 Tax=Campylobacter mucosalis CCUG 21559 TaxID=1032067 RepID=A0A6G5QFL3_9BACT|nr:hypothetical protein [Campylobacter mucosalis]QCD44432.1 hypothetical protein CMUC_0633 [Campylobacter mucosalis CCUG 21559]
MSKTQRAVMAFSHRELKELVRDFPYLKHLREALSIKSGRRLRVYVASPYDTLLNEGHSMTVVKHEAVSAINSAKARFGLKFDLFSPVLEFGGANISRDEAMKRCFSELIECDFLYIGKTLYFWASLGIFAEYEFATTHGICVVFESLEVKNEFLRAWGLYNEFI